MQVSVRVCYLGYVGWGVSATQEWLCYFWAQTEEEPQRQRQGERQQQAQHKKFSSVRRGRVSY
jgi:hypothetical protein